MALSFTERAANQVLNYLEERGWDGHPYHCAVVQMFGMAYQLVFVDEQEAHDVVFCSHDAKILLIPSH